MATRADTGESRGQVVTYGWQPAQQCSSRYVHVERQCQKHCAVHSLNHLLQKRLITTDNETTNKEVGSLINMHHYCMLATSAELSLFERQEQFDALCDQQKLGVMHDTQAYCERGGNYTIQVIEMCLNDIGFSHDTHWSTNGHLRWDIIRPILEARNCVGLIVCLPGHYTALSRVVESCWDVESAKELCYAYIDSFGKRWAKVHRGRVGEEIAALAGEEPLAVMPVFITKASRLFFTTPQFLERAGCHRGKGRASLKCSFV